jgi:transcriptional regulator NrdR family protein
MRCPHCDSEYKSRILETRLDGEDVSRRRECANCGQHFATREQIDTNRKVAPRPGKVFVRKTPEGGNENRALEGVWK